MNNLTLHSKGLEKEEQTNPKARRIEIIMIRVEINNKKNREKSIKPKVNSLKRSKKLTFS